MKGILLLLLMFPGWLLAQRADSLAVILRKNDLSHTFIVAHRGDWRNAPENSLEAIANCIRMGIDMVEIDIQMTKDSVFVLMHDGSVDRATSGSGKVSELTWSEIQSFNLKDGLGSWTRHKVPRLEEALDLTKGKILVNLDKSYGYIDLIYPLIKSRAMQNQIVFKGWMKGFDDVKKDIKTPIDSICFIPILDTADKHWRNVWASYSGKYKPVAAEILFAREDAGLEAIKVVTTSGGRAWVNTLWPDMNAGHDDELALTHLDDAYGWLIRHSVSIIQTDRISILSNFIRR